MTQEEFVDLCYTGNYTQISEAIRSGIDPNQTITLEGKIFSPMFAASSSGNEGAVKALAENGAECSEGFCIAIWCNKLKIIDVLMECGADINALGDTGDNALIIAVNSNNLEAVEKIISFGADVNAKSKAGYDCLTYAAIISSPKEDRKMNPRIITLLLEHGADYYYAIQLAARVNNAKFIRILIDKGADVNSLDENGVSLVTYAAITDNEEALRLLLENGADPNIHDSDGYTSLARAILDDEAGINIVNTLLEFGADVNAVDNLGLSVLMLSVLYAGRMPDMLLPSYLQTTGRDSKDWKKFFAFDTIYASSNRRQQLDKIKSLIKNGADVNMIDRQGMTALMYALAKKDDEVADILKDAGARINFDVN